MSSIFSFSFDTVKRVLPTAIHEGGSFYQEKLRGTELQAMVPAAIAKGAYHLTMQGRSINAYTCNRLIVGLGLAWAACAYKGLGERLWLKDWAAIAFLPTVNAVIEHVTPQATSRSTASNSYVSHTNQERIRFALKTVALMAQACALYKLQCDRNGSLPLKPYLYYGASVVLLQQVNNRYIRPGIEKRIKDNTGDFSAFALFAFDAYQVYSRIFLGSSIAAHLTGEEVQVSKTWEVLSFVGARLANEML